MNTNMQNNYDKYFKRHYSKTKSNYNTEIDNTIPQLFSSIRTEGGDEFEYNKRGPLTDYIISTWDKPLRKNIVLLGDGGAGKTTNLLASYTDLVEQGINCAFVPLSSLEAMDVATIENYFKEYIIRKKDDFDDFLEFIESDGKKYKKPCFVLFLDGYNEVYISKNELYIDLRRWLSYDGIQTVISTREGLSDITYLKTITTEFATLRPLDYQRMVTFVKKRYPEIDTKKLSPFVLENPMMLMLFVSTQKYLEKYKSNSMMHLRQEYTAGSIIWNFMQLQILKYNELLRGKKEFGYEQCNLLVIINCILPYVGWAMERRQRIAITYEEFDDLISNAYIGNLDTCKQALTECCYDNGIYTWTFDEMPIKKIILDKLGFFKKNNRMIQFRHQNYRDFFAAYYFYTNVFDEDTDIKENKKVWEAELISFDSMKLLCDLLSDSQVQMLAKYCENKEEQEDSYAVDNLFQVYNIVYEGNLSQITLKNIDLRKTFLNQYKWVEKGCATKFCGCILSNTSFYGDGHHGRVIIAEYSPDNKYVASSCTAGEIKIWQSGSGKKLYELKENSSIYALCWVNNHEFIYGTIKGACYIYNIAHDKNNKLFEIESAGIKTVCCHNSKLYVGCTNGDFLQGDTKKVKRILSIQEAIVKILYIEHTIFLLDAVGNLWLYSLNNNLLHRMNTLKHTITNVCYSRDYIIACTLDGCILWWSRGELTSNNMSIPLKKIINESLRFSCIKSNENKLICGTQNGEVIIFDTEKAENLILPIEHIGWVRTISFSNKSKEIVSGGSDGKVILWDMNSLSKKIEKCGIPNMVLCHDYIQDSNIIISSSNDSKIIVWDLKTVSKVKELTGHVDWVRCIATGNKKDIFSSGGSDGRINIWYIQDRMTMNITNTLLYQGESWIMSLDWNYDDSSLVSGMRNGEIHLWQKTEQMYDDKLIYSHPSPVCCVRFSPSGKYIASSDQKGYIYIYDYKKTKIIKISDRPIRQIRWSRDELYLYACCLEGYIVKFRFEKNSLVEMARIESFGARSIEPLDEKLLFAGISQELWTTNFFHKSTIIDKCHFDSIDYIAHNKNYYSTSGHDGNIIVRDKQISGKIVTLKLIPDINISGCKFVNCSFENEELCRVLRMNGGIITSDSSQ